jgi:two-component system, OmpR family, sensor histidine kinase KdpD
MRIDALPSPLKLLPAYVWAAIAPVAGTFLVLPFRLSIGLSNVALLYVLSVVISAARFGRGPAVATALLSSLLFAYVFVPPHFSLAITETRSVLSAVIMLVVALIVGHITSKLKQHADFLEQKSRQSKTLYEFSQALSGAQTIQAVSETTQRFLADALGAQHSQIIYPADFAAPPAPADATLIAACIANKALVWQPTGTGRACIMLPLHATSSIQGVLGFEAESALPGEPDAVEYIETIASVVSVTLERSHFAESARASELKHASELLRSSILGALSHDLRTPLAALVSMADTAALGKASPERQKHLLEAIRKQSMSICEQMMKLLEMARLSSGTVELNRAWQPVEEVVGCVLSLIRSQWKAREISLDVAPALPPICIDAVLIERVLWNLLENAIKYSPADTTIELAIHQTGDKMEIRVSDSGDGLPDGDTGRLFKLFQRGKAESGVAGVGLGLAISQTIVEAHEGTITASNRLGGGACFRVTLPIGNPPDELVLE